MRSLALHPALQQLILYVDGELSRRAMARVRKHLAACEQCSGQLRRLTTASDQFASAHHDSRPAQVDLAGPRAMLKARLAETARPNREAGHNSLRMARGVAYACALAVLIALGVTAVRRSSSPAIFYTRLEPDPAFTPGLARTVSLSDLCSVDRDEVVRAVPAAIEQRIFHEYGISSGSSTDYEVDYLITPGLGGADDLRNLWPQPHAHTVWNSYVKDQLEDRLHGMVCDGKLSLAVAQQEIAGDWIAAYKKYFHAEMPIAAPLHARLDKRDRSMSGRLASAFLRKHASA